MKGAQAPPRGLWKPSPLRNPRREPTVDNFFLMRMQRVNRDLWFKFLKTCAAKNLDAVDVFHTLLQMYVDDAAVAATQTQTPQQD